MKLIRVVKTYVILSIMQKMHKRLYCVKFVLKSEDVSICETSYPYFCIQKLKKRSKDLEI